MPAGDAGRAGRGAAGRWPPIPPCRARMGDAARERAERFAWPRVAAEVSEVYEQAVAVPRTETGMARVGAARRSQARRARAAHPAGAAAVARAGRTRRAGAAQPVRLARRGDRRGRRGGRRGPHRARARAARHRVDRPRAAGRHAGLGARRLHAHVRLDARPRGGLARDPARRPAGHARAPPRHRARDDDRRAHVGDPAGAARRAVARPDRLAQARPDARPLPGRARHARLPDDPQHPRAVRARHRHVRHRRRVQPRRGRAGDRHDRAGRAAGAGGRVALDPAPRQAVALPARAAGGRRRAARDAAGAHRAPGVQEAAPRRLGHLDAADRVGDPVARLLRAARGARARSTTPGSAPPPPCSSR